MAGNADPLDEYKGHYADNPLDGYADRGYTIRMDPKYLPLGRRNQITLPKETVSEGISLYRCEKLEDGSILLTPQVPVPASQAYFWSKRWQEGEAQAGADAKAGRVHRYGSAKQLMEAIQRRRKK